MTTWNPFNPALPATGGPTRQADITAIRQNLFAIAAQAAAGVAPYMWARVQTGADETQPDTDVYSKGVQRIRLTYTWGTSGGANKNATKIVFEYSADSGSNYYPMLDEEGNYVMNYTYSASFINTADTPGATP